MVIAHFILFYICIAKMISWYHDNFFDPTCPFLYGLARYYYDFSPSSYAVIDIGFEREVYTVMENGGNFEVEVNILVPLDASILPSSSFAILSAMVFSVSAICKGFNIIKC